MFGSLAVNARAGLGSPYPRPLQSGDELQAAPASGAAERRIELPAIPDAPIRIVFGPQDDEFAADTKKLFLDSEWKISATSDRMGYRIEGPVIRHLDGHNIVSDGTVNGSIQVPGNGQPIVLMPDRGTSGGYPKIAAVISADLGRFAQIPAGRAFRFKAVSMTEAQAELRKFRELLRTLPDRLRDIESFDLNIEALHDANVAGHAVSAVDAGTWHVASPADALGPD
jgi:allophanate hydrolase subunit 2